MKSIILYSLPPNSRFAGAYWKVFLPGKSGDYIPVRAEVVDGDIVQALNRATPLLSETVLNTLPFSE